MGTPATDAAARLRLLYEVTSLRLGTLEARLDATLEVITQALALDVSFVSRIEKGVYTVERVYDPGGTFHQGQAFPLDRTYGDLTLKADGVLSIARLQTSRHARHPFYLRFGHEAYLGAAVMTHGSVHGTLCLLGSASRETPFTEADEELVVLLARWVGVVLEAQLNEARRRESEARFRSAFHDAAIGMAMVAPNGHPLDVNTSLCEMLGYSRDELLAIGFQPLTHPDDLDADLRKFQRVLSGQLETYKFEKRFLHRTGHLVWGHLSVSAVRGDDGSVRYVIGQVQDITARKHYEAQVRIMAYRDELTGLHNRRYFFEQAPAQLALARRSGWPVALAYLDLNNFKEINDTIGHEAGNELLKQAVTRFRGVLREEDLFARFGGDEFVVLLLNVTEAEARGAAERLVGCLRRPFHLLDAPRHVGLSVGVVLAPDGAADTDALVSQADKAMYRAKGRKASEPYAVEVVLLGSSPFLS